MFAKRKGDKKRGCTRKPEGMFGIRQTSLENAGLRNGKTAKRETGNKMK